MEAGESPEEALVREIREELDTEISVDEYLTTIEWDYPEFHLTMHCYMCSLVTDALHLNEHEAACWLTAANLRSVNWLPADYSILELLENELECHHYSIAAGIVLASGSGEISEAGCPCAGTGAEGRL